MSFKYSELNLDFLRAGFPKLSVEDLTNKFNEKFGMSKTPGQIRSALKNNGIKCGRKSGELNKGSKKYTAQIREFIEVQYKTHSRTELANLVNTEFGTECTPAQIASYCKRVKIVSGRSGQFVDGDTPWNTNTKGLMKPNAGSFKPGSKPSNQNDFGHERICPKDHYILIKIDEINPHTGFRGRYVHKHRWVWEQHYGKVPEGKIVSLIDGNKQNCDPSNLELIDRGILARFNKNQLSKAPCEIKPALRTLIKLQVSVNRLNVGCE